MTCFLKCIFFSSKRNSFSPPPILCHFSGRKKKENGRRKRWFLTFSIQSSLPFLSFFLSFSQLFSSFHREKIFIQSCISFELLSPSFQSFDHHHFFPSFLISFFLFHFLVPVIWFLFRKNESEVRRKKKKIVFGIRSSRKRNWIGN